ncbi:hypothetical protein M9458_027735, partial [Cirrhinus mrigala]
MDDQCIIGLLHHFGKRKTVRDPNTAAHTVPLWTFIIIIILILTVCDSNLPERFYSSDALFR